ncbi:MAG: thioredoxin domain-containing protein [Nanoarchaeota archaeon]
MVLCLVALPIFAILGIFSLKYRKLARDSLNCIFHTVTFRKCESGLDDKIKSGITGMLLKYSPWGAGVVYRHYQLLSWILIIMLVWSAYTSAVGINNYIRYGNCNGPESTGFCVFDPTGQNTGTSVFESQLDSLMPANVTIPEVDNHNPIIGPKNAALTIIEFGCYSCEYTRHAEPILQDVLRQYPGLVNIQFKHLTIPNHQTGTLAAIAANCAQEQGQYTIYHNLIFENQANLSDVKLRMMALDLGLDITKFGECIKSGRHDSELASDNLEGLKAGVTGTPTFFINGKKIVGPKPLRTFQTLIDEELKTIAATGRGGK